MMAKPSDKTVHLAKSITEAIQIGRVSLLSRGYGLFRVCCVLAVKLDGVGSGQRRPPDRVRGCNVRTLRVLKMGRVPVDRSQ